MYARSFLAQAARLDAATQAEGVILRAGEHLAPPASAGPLWIDTGGRAKLLLE
jgi:hypothetical protein